MAPGTVPMAAPALQRIVVGVDGREGGRDALALASLLQRAGGGELVAVHVYQYDRSVPSDDPDDLEASLRAELTADLERELADAGLTARAVIACDRSAARALHAAAEREHADVIVVGSSHRAGAGRILAGDDAVATLHGAPCAVAVAPRGHASAPRALTTIGVGYDGSPEAHLALEFAATLARAADARVLCTTVVSQAAPPPLGAGLVRGGPAARRESMEIGQALVDRAAAELGERGAADLAVGDTGRVLTERSGNVDLLVVGSRAQGPVRRVLLGSTSTDLLRDAPCPVLVLPRGARVPTHHAR